MVAAWIDHIYEDIVETTRNPFLVLDLDLRILMVNRTFYDTFKLTPEETIGNLIYDLGDRQWDIPKLRTLLEAVIPKENKFDNFEIEHVFPSIGHKVMLLNARRIIHKEIGPQMILLNIEDITERRQAKRILMESEERYRRGFETAMANRKQAEKELGESEQQYCGLFDSVPIGLYRTTPDGHILDANPALLEILGYPDKETLSKLTMAELYVNAEDRLGWQTLIKREGIVINFETQLRRRNGETIWVRENARGVLGDDHKVLYYDGSLENITEQRKLEAQLIQARKMAAIGRLAGGVAHDFNNLLTTIIGNTGILLMRNQREGHLRECLEEIKDAGMRAAALTRQLLAFSRKQTLRLVVLNLNEVITGINKMLMRLIGEDVKVGTVLESDLLKIKADRSQMEQLIMNLAVNAKDAMSRGGKLTIKTANVYLDEAYAREHGVELTPGPYVMLAVSDTGIGMDEETRSHIFEPFFTTKEKDVGTGLGLSTVYGIVKQMNGFIWVYSEPGQGSTFKIYLPRVEKASDPVKKDPALIERLDGFETVLLVEDDKKVLNMVQKTLNMYGYNVLKAQCGEDALKVTEAHEGRIHLIVTDVVMSGMSGRELVERIKSILPEIKIIYMSGYTDNVISLHGVLEPGINFFEKPFTPESLMRKIREVLDA